MHTFFYSSGVPLRPSGLRVGLLLQVLASLRARCGLSAAIPHAFLSVILAVSPQHRLTALDGEQIYENNSITSGQDGENHRIHRHSPHLLFLLWPQPDEVREAVPSRSATETAPIFYIEACSGFSERGCTRRGKGTYGTEEACREAAARETDREGAFRIGGRHSLQNTPTQRGSGGFTKAKKAGRRAAEAAGRIEPNAYCFYGNGACKLFQI